MGLDRSAMDWRCEPGRGLDGRAVDWIGKQWRAMDRTGMVSYGRGGGFRATTSFLKDKT